MAGRVKTTMEVRFHEKYDRRGDDECWPWLANKSKAGYGQFYLTYIGNKPAHRVSYTLATGQEIPTGMHVMHSCDNPCCVNPRHLSVGSPADNHRDMVAKGRDSKPPTRREDAHHKAKLTRRTVRECRERYTNGESLCALAREFDVNKSAMRHALRGKHWPEAGGPLAKPEPRKFETYVGSVHANSKLTEEIVKEARSRHATGESGHSLAKEYGVHFVTLYEALRGKTWKHVT